MPGPVSDSFDPEWGTTANGELVRESIQEMHGVLGKIIGLPPLPILDVVTREPGPLLAAELSETQWRILRFACERAAESV
jgi:hypothetical protein